MKLFHHAVPLSLPLCLLLQAPFQVQVANAQATPPTAPLTASPAPAPATGAASASNPLPDAVPVIERWRDYFQALNTLNSLSYQTRFQMWDRAKPPAPANADIRSSHTRQGTHFRNELAYNENGKAGDTIIYAYGGKKYQTVAKGRHIIEGYIARAVMTQSNTPQNDDPSVLSAFHAAFTIPFMFVEPDKEDLTWAMLSSPATWDAAIKRVTAVTSTTELDRPGKRLTFSYDMGQPDEKKIEVFADEATGLPLVSRSFDSKTGKLQGEIIIRQWREAENGLPVFPLRVVLSGENKAQQNTTPGNSPPAMGNALVEVNPATLQMNSTLPETLFSIPFTQVDIAVEGDNVIYNNLKEKVPTPKTTAKPNSKTKPVAKPASKPTTKPKTNSTSKSKRP